MHIDLLHCIHQLIKWTTIPCYVDIHRPLVIEPDWFTKHLQFCWVVSSEIYSQTKISDHEILDRRTDIEIVRM